MSEAGEKSFIARVQKGFRVQIPEVVRELLNIREGDIVEVRVRKEVGYKRGGDV